MTYARSIALLVLYAAFVLIVLGADLWHIFTRCSKVIFFGFWCMLPANLSSSAMQCRSVTPVQNAPGHLLCR